MYLARLDLEKRHMFLDLDLYMARVDGEFSDSERQIVDSHCYEMRIDNNDYECELPYDELISKIKDEFSPEEKRIIFLEILAVVSADKVYHDFEQEMMKQIEKACDVSEEDAGEVYRAILKTKEVYEDFAHFVFRGEK